MEDCRQVDIPFNPSGTVDLIQVIGPIPFVYPSAESLQLFKGNPRRLWLLVMPTTPTLGLHLLPYKLGQTAGIGPLSGTGYVLIHNASLPGLVQGEWWSHNPMGTELILYEGQRYEK